METKAELKSTIMDLAAENIELRRVILDFEKIPVPRSVISQIAELTKQVRDLEEDIEFYKPHIPLAVIINRKNKDKPTRQGGFKDKSGRKS